MSQPAYSGKVIPLRRCAKHQAPPPTPPTPPPPRASEPPVNAEAMWVRQALYREQGRNENLTRDNQRKENDLLAAMEDVQYWKDQSADHKTYVIAWRIVAGMEAVLLLGLIALLFSRPWLPWLLGR